MLAGQIEGFEARVRIVDVPGQRYFHKARAQNLGAARTRQELLFFCDADIILEPETLSALVGKLLERPNSFATLAGVRETEPNARGGNHVVCFGYELRIRVANGRELKIVDHEEDVEDGTRNAPGLLLVRRKHFIEIEGYNSELHGWGWEDQDMIGRLTLGAGLERTLFGHALHVSHEDTLRIANYPVSNRWESRDKMFRQALANYDRGNFMGTYSADVRRVPATLILPRPTRGSGRPPRVRSDGSEPSEERREH
jgi:hypothetical protein